MLRKRFGWYIVCDEASSSMRCSTQLIAASSVKQHKLNNRIPYVEVAVEHAVGELMFGCNLLSFSVTDEEAWSSGLAWEGSVVRYDLIPQRN